MQEPSTERVAACRKFQRVTPILRLYAASGIFGYALECNQHRVVAWHPADNVFAEIMHTCIHKNDHNLIVVQFIPWPTFVVPNGILQHRSRLDR